MGGTTDSKTQKAKNVTKGQRSRAGCQTCRRRKVRCDEQKPECRTCGRLGLDCAFTDKTTNNRRAYNVRFAAPKGLPSVDPPDSQSETEGWADPPAEVDTNYEEGPANILLNAGESNEIGFDTGSSFSLESHGPPADLRVSPLLDSNWTFLNSADDASFELGWQPQAQLLEAPIPPAQLGHVLEDVGEHQTAETHLENGGGEGVLTSVEIGQADQEPLQHFLGTMTKFSKMRATSQDDLYTTIFSTLALSHQQLFQAMMAWSSLHLAQTQNRSTLEAEARFEIASNLLMANTRPLEHIDVTMITILFLLQFELFRADGTDRFCALLHYASSILRRFFEKNDLFQASSRLGKLGVQCIVTLSAFDARAAFFGTSGHFLGLLREVPYIYDLIEQNGSALGSGLHAVPQQVSLRSGLPTSLRLALRLRIILGQIKLLRYHPGNHTKDEIWTAVDSNLRILKHELDRHDAQGQAVLKVAMGDLGAMPDMSQDHYNRMMLLASFYSAVILYQEYRSPRLLHTTDDFLPSSDCALRIMRLVNRANLANPHSPQAVWPHLIFIAGLACQDPIYQSWAVRTLQCAEFWGRNIYKVRVLLETVFEMQNRTRMPVDVVSVMKETTGLFIM